MEELFIAYLNGNLMWKAIPAEYLKFGNKVCLSDGIKVVEKVEQCKPLSLAEVNVTWKGGQVERFCNFKQLLVEQKGEHGNDNGDS